MTPLSRAGLCRFACDKVSPLQNKRIIKRIKTHNIAGCTDAQRDDVSWVNTKAGTGAMWHTSNQVHISRNLRLKNLERDPAHALPRWRGAHGAVLRRCWKNRNGFGPRAERNCTAGKSLPATLMNAVLQVLGNVRRWDVRGRSGPARSRAWRKVMMWGVHGVATPRPREANGEVKGYLCRQTWTSPKRDTI